MLTERAGRGGWVNLQRFDVSACLNVNCWEARLRVTGAYPARCY